MNDKLTNLIDLNSDYFISDINYANDCIIIDIEYSSKIVKCPMCKTPTKIHDRLLKTWRHTNFDNNKVYIRFKNPRANCINHGVKIVNVSWAKPRHRFTNELEELVCTLAQNNSYLKIAKQLDEHDTRIRRIVKGRKNEKDL